MKINRLDKGYIRLVDVMGNDDTVVNAARVSFDKESDKYTDEQNDRLIDFLAREGHCYDEKTEVLTAKGFKLWKDVGYEDEIAAIQPRTGELKGFEKPIELQKYKVDDELIRFKSDAVDLLVTKGHSLYCSLSDTVEKRNNPDYGLFYADMKIGGREVYKKPMRMKTQITINEEVKKDKEYYLAALYGFFVGDGNASSRNQIKFHLKKERKINYLKKVAEKSGYEVVDQAANKYVIHFDNIGDEFRELFYNESNEKTFPTRFVHKGYNFWAGFEEGLKNSDGSVRERNEKEWSYTTKSVELANKIQFGGAVNGSQFNISKNSRGLYKLIKILRRVEPRLNDNRHNKYELVNYKGNVYCATVSTGLLMVRRNGKVVLSGNSSPFRHAVMQFEVYAPMMVVRQWEKYLIGSNNSEFGARNESSRRYITEDEEFYIPNANEWRSYPKDVKQGSGKPVHRVLGSSLSTDLMEYIDLGERLYRHALEDGIAPEQARLFLPAYGLYVRFRWTATLQTVAHLIKQRTAKDAQYEFRVYAEAIKQIAMDKFPVSLEALLKER